MEKENNFERREIFGGLEADISCTCEIQNFYFLMDWYNLSGAVWNTPAQSSIKLKAK